MTVRDVLCFALGAFVAAGIVYIAADPAAAIIGVLVVAGGVIGFIGLGVAAGAEI